MAEYFEYQKTAREAGITPEQLEVIKRDIREDYPHDNMLWELHVLRACMAIRDGTTTFDAAFGSSRTMRAEG